MGIKGAGSFRPSYIPEQSIYAPVAQWIEHLTTDQEVTGSTPVGRAISLPVVLVSTRLITYQSPLLSRSEVRSIFWE